MGAFRVLTWVLLGAAGFCKGSIRVLAFWGSERESDKGGKKGFGAYGFRGLGFRVFIGTEIARCEEGVGRRILLRSALSAYYACRQRSK